MSVDSFDVGHIFSGQNMDSFCERRYACGTFDSLKDGQKICGSDSKCSHVYDFGCDHKVFCLCPKGAKILKSEHNSCLFEKEEQDNRLHN